MKTTKIITIKHEGFHGRVCVRVRVPVSAAPGDCVVLSKRVARRLDDAVCGHQGCMCGEQLTGCAGIEHHCDRNGYDCLAIVVPAPDEIIKGRYA